MRYDERMRPPRIIVPCLLAPLVAGCYSGLDPEDFGSSGVGNTSLPSTSAGNETTTDGTDSAEGGSQSGGTDPSTTDPSTTDPSTTDPSTTDPSTTDPSTTDPSTTDPSTTDPSTTDDPSTTGDPNMLDGLSINEVAIYQGPKRTLAANGNKVNSNVPLVRGRDALVRIFYTANGEAAGAQVRAELDIAGQGTLEFNTTVNGTSTDASLNSTINFELDGSQIGANFDYSVAIYEINENQVPSAAYPNGGSESHTVEGAQQTLRVTLVPYAYNADGSGRTPDTSASAVAAYREAFLATYPVSDVQITVHAPVNWNSQISPFGQGWSQVLNNTAQLRSNEVGGNSPEYYYGIFDPASSFNNFCGQGCILGLAPLNTSNNGSLRYGVGVGFIQYALTTAIHEIGHAHGRAHVNCGPGLDPNSVDGQYPHNPQTIGVWGWDIVDTLLKNPNQNTDFMGYCDSQFVSDYTYRALYLRGNNINQPNVVEPEDYAVLSTDGAGEGEWISPDPLEFGRFMDAPNASATMIDAQGRSYELEGHYVGFDHLPGGQVFLPEIALEAVFIEVRAGGIITHVG